MPTLTARMVEACEGSLPTGPDWEALVACDRPMLFKGAARDWKLVRAGLENIESAARVLREAHSGQPVVVYRGKPEIAGRFFYTPAVDGFNFSGTREPLVDVLDELLMLQDDLSPPAIYVGSTDLAIFFPGLAAHSALDLAAIHPALVEHPGLGSLWLGNRTTATCHYDYSANIAICAVGRRRFTLFPPEQAVNLYPGPLDPTPGGQVVSMVDFAALDLERFPRFAKALEVAEVAEMAPGDVLVYPAMWWHHVEALESFNVLVNYWWNAAGAHVDSPQLTLLHAMMSLRDRPAGEKAAWRALFDYYIFGDPDIPRAHLPELAQGVLAPIDEITSHRLRAMLLRKLQR